MRLAKHLFALSLLLGVVVGCTSTARSTTSIPERTVTAPSTPALPTDTPVRPAGTPLSAARTPLPCPVTLPNGNTPPGEGPAPDYYGNGKVWTGLYPAGTVSVTPADVRSDGTFDVKFYWWRGIQGQLAIQGRRLDAPAPPLQAIIPTGYGDIGFQSTALLFPSEGCWEVTGTVSGKGGVASLTFVTRVMKVEPLPGQPPASPTTAP